MKVCIVGGTGNISTSFIPLLLAQGHEVTLYNRGKRHPAPAGVRVITGDRKERALFEKTIQGEKFDVGIDMILYNAEDAASTKRAFEGKHLKQLIYCSTVCAYGVDYDYTPVREDHNLRPITGYGQGKSLADYFFLEAHQKEGLPVTIIRPSTTYGPQMGALRQIAWDFGWIDRVRKGKPIAVCDDGRAPHQFLHVDDAALGFVGAIGKNKCIGQVYNLVARGHTNWADYHRTAMKVLGREVPIVGIPREKLFELEPKRADICRTIFANQCVYSGEKIYNDIPEFRPKVPLEQGLRSVIEEMDKTGRVPNTDGETWEDELIAKAGKVL
jgi:nucleoside-diphosphate-sugar epimerase